MMTKLPFFNPGIAMRLFFAFLFLTFSTGKLHAQCYNVTGPGSVSGTQTSCGAFDPLAITSTGHSTGGSGVREYQWMYKSAATGWSLTAISGATSESYDPGYLTETTKFIRCARRQGCTSWPQETPALTITVNPLVVAGSISGNQTFCDGGDPTMFTNSSSASGGNGSIIYRWQKRTLGGTWITNSSANTAAYDPSGLINSTTEYRRGAKTASCENWENSNIITVTVTPCCDNVTGPGSVSGTQSSCGPFDPSIISNVNHSTGGTGAREYQWMYKSAATGWSLTAISGATSESYDPGYLTETTKFIRCARRQGCTSWPQETPALTITVNPLVVAGSISGNQTFCDGGDPTMFTNSSSASGGNGSIIYRWQKRVAGGTWITNSSAISATYNPGWISSTTEYRRGAKTASCENWENSNIITVTVTSCCDNVTGPGSVAGTQSSCGPFDPSIISNVNHSTGGTGAREYQWMYKSAATGWSLTAISGATSESYDPGYLTETTKFIRCARRQGCTSWPQETPPITISVSPGITASVNTTDAGCPELVQVCDLSDYNNSRTMWMPNLGVTSGISKFSFVNNSGKLYQYSDGTAHMYGEAVKTDDSNKKWIISVWFKDKKDWATWNDNGNGGSYKNGGGSTSNDHLNWDYYIMDPAKENKATGQLDFVGVELDLTHAPSNHLYAMQVGTGANDQDMDYGISFWFDYTSSHPDFSSGNGDFNFDASCADQSICAGTASVTVTGGTAPYIYSWSNGAYGNELNGLCAGTYNVTVTDANGCSTVLTETVAAGSCCENVVAGSIAANQSNCGAFDPAEITSTTLATGPGIIEYIWVYQNSSTGIGFQQIAGATGITYDPGMVTETTIFRRWSRIQGCVGWLTGSNDVIITVYTGPSIGAINSTDATGNGIADGTAMVSANGGTSPYTYSWSNGATTASVTGLLAGTYTVVITDANGCTTTETVTVGEPNALTSSVSSTDVTCNGDADGTATIVVNGGTSPYTYLWSNGQTTATATGLLVGTYTVVATDANGYTTSQTVTVVEPSALASSSSSTDVTCFDDNDGTATATVNGGTSPYTYSWSNGAATSTITGLDAGSYTVTMTDANGCTTTQTVTVVEPSALTSSVSSTDATGNGIADGTAMVSANGGTSPYTYLWSNGATTASVTGLLAGTYTVVITDANGCTTTETVTVGEPNALTSSVSSTDVTCNGDADGTATIVVNGGTSPYTYLWSNGQTTATATGLLVGTYTVVATDANGYTTSQTVTVVEPSALASSSSSTDVTCFDDNDGTATATVNGGTSPYTYSWSNGATTSTITGLDAGSYTVTMTDANGCTTTQTVTVVEPSVLASSSSSTDATGNGIADGTAMVVANGGTSPYTYLWSNGATTASVTGLLAGTYTVVITDANGCTTTETVTVGEPNALTSSVSSTDVTCNGDADGTATIVVNGGTSPYTYLWSNGQTTATATGLLAGTYTVVATDANGYTTTETVTVIEPSALTSSSSSTDATGNGIADGTAMVSANGGTSPYTYLWSNGATTASVTGLLAGTYTVVITDANGCTTTETVTVGEPNALTSSVSSTDVTCNGDADGTATIVVNGGTSPYTYLWSNGQTTATATGLLAGTYTVVSTDANGYTTTETVIVIEPSALTSSSSSTDATGNGIADGTAMVSANGGTSPYTYLWSNGATTASVTGLLAGTYTVVITDANGCTTTETVTVGEPNALTSSVSSTDVTCNGDADGTATIVVNGGTSPYTYLWSNGQMTATATGLLAGIYTVVATDANGYTTTETVTVIEPSALTSSSSSTDATGNGIADGTAMVSANGGTSPYTYLWSNGATTASVTGLLAGTYTVVVTDANGCTTTETVTVGEPNALTSSVSSTDVTCNGDADGTATIVVNGGTSPYTYLWSNGQTTATATGLLAGIYTVVATDANGYTTTETVTVIEPSALTSSSSSTDATGNGIADGTAMVSANGGTSPYTYLWSNGATTASVTGLLAGTYTVVVTDANGCTTTETVTVGEPNALTSSVSSTDVTCNGDSDGTATIVVNGGTSPYTYLWSNGQTTATATGLLAGTYTVVATDANGYTTTETVTVVEPSALTSSSSSTDATGNGIADGTAMVVANGGTSPYTYLWSNGATTATATGLLAGTYTVVVTDANGCTTTETVTVGEPNALTSSVSSTDVTCNGDSDGTATIVVNGGTSPYTYLWSNGQTTATATGLLAGTYTVVATDANGYTTTETVTVVEPSALTSSSSSTDATGNGIADGTAMVVANGGTSPYTYLWSNGATTATATGLLAGTYTVVVTDANGCTTTETVTVGEPNALTSSVSSTDVTCNGDSDGTATIVVNGGTSPYTYLWSNGQMTATATGLLAGTYTVVATDANGYTTTETVTVIEPSALTSSSSSTDATGNGIADGTAMVSANGGTSPYTYLWSNGATTASVTGLLAGTYTVVITDANGCTTTETVTVGEPNALTSSVSSTDVTCNGDADGTATIVVNGGTSPYTYLWSNGQTTATATGLLAGIYTVVATDANGYTTTETVTVVEPSALTSSSSSTDVTCFDDNDGTATATVNGGTSPYTYSWSNGATTSTITGLDAGSYTVTMTDANGCTTTETVTVVEPSALTSSSSSTDATGNGIADGTAMVSANGGTSPYTYLWSNGATTASVTGLLAGTYTVVITDANGCTTTETVTVGEPNALTSSVSSTDVTCNGDADGTATIVVNGGTSPYTYLWSNGQTTATATGLLAGTYTVVATDANGYTTTETVTVVEPSALASSSSSTDATGNGIADGTAMVVANGGTSPYTYLWSNGATTASVTGLLAGTYTVVITDANGCTTTETVTVGEPNALTSSVSSTDVTCNGDADGTATIVVNGGTSPYTYLWSNGQTTATATGLLAGTYTVVSTDANGYTTTETVTVIEPSALTSSSSSTDATGNGIADGTAMVVANGGTSPYTYLWSNGATTASVTGLLAGTYTVVITDANGCTTTETVTVGEPNALTSSVSSTDVTCNGDADGTATIVVNGGTSPYTYLWSNGQMTATATGLLAGTYTVVATDANGYTTSQTVTVVEPSALASSSSSTDVTCFDDNDGTATATVNGGTSPYTYSWSNGATTSTITGLDAGSYTVTMTDANGCTTTETVTVVEPSALASSSSSTDATGNGIADGTAMVVANGGTSAYTYLWSNGATTASVTGLLAGTYTVVITDANGCTTTETVTVGEPNALTSSVSSTDVTCNGDADGTATIVVNGGTSPYTYLWSNGQTTATATGLLAGTYTVVATDANGYTTTQTAVVGEPTAIVNNGSVINAISCNGANDGSIVLNVIGGTMPYTYLWSNGATTSTITNLLNGTYSVVVTDANGCVASFNNIAINEPSALISSASSTDASANGLADGTASVTVSAGMPGYTYLWSNGATTASITGLLAGTYTVVVTDANGCTTTETVTVGEPNALTSSVSSTDVTCNGDADGTATIVVNGGTSPYTYLWSNGQTTATATGLLAGIYTVVATDANGYTTSQTVTVVEPSALASSSSSTDVTCFDDNDGTATATVNGGTSPYTYSWSNGATTSTITGLDAGSYTVTMTDANGCTTTQTVTVVEPSALTSSSSSTDATGNGIADGTAMVVANGGTSPYTYLWSNGATTASVTGLLAGTYTVVITDANGCTTTETVTVGEPNALTSSVSSTDVTCNGDADGTATIVVNGGTSPYTYLWSNGQTTATATGLLAGTYTVVSTDANGYTTTETVTVIEPSALTSSSSSTDATGNGIADGTAMVVANGGTSPYTYLWSNGATTASVTGLLAGTYTVVITDANGCTTTETVTVGEPNALTSSVSSTDVTCNGDADGTATIVVNGGTSPYTYLWSNGQTTATATGLLAGTYTVVATDANGYTTTQTAVVGEPTAIVNNGSVINAISCNGANDGSIVLNVIGGTMPYTYLWSNGATTSTITNLLNGTYSVVVTDANGCVASFNNIAINEPSALTSSASSTDATGNGIADGTAMVIANGGTSPYTYLWSNGATTASLTGLAAGTYTVVITDANGCTTTETVTIGEPNALTSSISSTDVLCNGDNDGTATIVVNGGTSPYTYLWSNGQTTATATGLLAGTYTVVATDANGYTTTQTAVVGEPTAIVNNGSVINAISCNGANDGSIILNIIGGTMPYTYLWSNGATTSSITSLSVGAYSVVATDANGCVASFNNIAIGEPTALVAVMDTTGVTCSGINDGTASVTVSGGTPAYSYLWSDGQTTATASGLAAGTYTVTVTDVSGCSITGSINVNADDCCDVAVVGSIGNAQTSCGPFDPSEITSFAPATGEGPIEYIWVYENASTGNVYQVVPGATGVTYDPGVVTETTTYRRCAGVQGCNSWPGETNTIVMTVYPVVIVDNVSTVPGVCGLSNGSATVTVTGGTAPFTYLWSNGATTATATGLAAGNYDVTISDANGCSADSIGIVVTQTTVLVVQNTTVTNVSCFNSCNGTAMATVTGGTLPYTYLWNDGQTTETATGLCVGTHNVTVTDVNGCSITENNITVTEPTLLSNSITTSVDVTCNGYNDGSATVSANGGTMPYTYLWSDGQTTETAANLIAGTYSVTITDANGCSVDVNNINITEPAALINISTIVTNPTCFGTCDGTITVNIGGGAGPYTYVWSMLIIDQITGDGTPTVSDLCKGLYSVTVTDANGCVITIDSIQVTEPAPIFNNNTIIDDVSCNGLSDGSVALSILGGTAPYTYLWSNGQTTSTATNLVAGTYSVVIEDANGCTLDINNVIVTEPIVLSSTASTIAHVSCNGMNDGSIYLNVVGGTAPYTYLWSDGQTTATASNLSGGTYSVVVTDANGCTLDVNNLDVAEPDVLVNVNTIITHATCFGSCDGSITIDITGGTAPYTYDWTMVIIDQITGDGTPTVSDLCKGLYSVTVTDANGCTITIENIEITEPAPIFNNNMVITDVTCNGDNNGSIDLDIIGGVAPYTYLWSNSEVTETISNLAAGTYSVTVTDANGCTLDVNNILISEPLLLENLSTSITSISCNSVCNGGIDLNIVGGIAPYTYAWNTGATTSSLADLCSGTYSVTVTDASGCTVVVNGIEIIEPSLLSVQMNAANVSCFTACDGSVEALVTGGTMPYTYNWSNGENTATIANLCDDTYTVNIVDAAGCTVNGSAIITQPTQLLVSTSSTDASCYASCDGTAEAVVVGGVQPYSYVWSNGDNTALVNGLCADTYDVTVTDANNCIVSSGNIVVNEPIQIQVQFTIDYTAGSITASAQNGLAPYSYVWNTGSFGSVISNLVDGMYTVNVTDHNGCSTSDSIMYVDGGGIIDQFMVDVVGPNPFVSETRIMLTATISTRIVVDLFDANGKIVKRAYEGSLESDTELEFVIRGNDLEPGMYFCRVLAADGSSVTKKIMLKE